jgi:hypothetical protein
MHDPFSSPTPEDYSKPKAHKALERFRQGQQVYMKQAYYTRSPQYYVRYALSVPTAMEQTFMETVAFGPHFAELMGVQGRPPSLVVMLSEPDRPPEFLERVLESLGVQIDYVQLEHQERHSEQGPNGVHTAV